MKETQYNYEELTKPQQECLALVESLGIYELRALARVFGGESPTTQKRNDHIRVVMDKIIEGKELKPIPLKQGRPHKEISTIEGILEQLSKITGVDYTNKSGKAYLQPTHKRIVFNQIEEDIIEQQLFPIKAKGIVIYDENNKNYYFYNQYNSRYVLISKDLESQVSVSDFVEGTAVIMNSNNDYLLTQISSVNLNLTNKSKNNKEKVFKFENKEYSLGLRYKFDNMTRYIDHSERICALIDNLKSKNVITLGVIPNVTEEDFLSFQLLNFDNLIAFKVSENPDVIFQSLKSGFEFVCKQQKLGNDVAVFLQDTVTLMNYGDYFFKNDQKCFMNHTEAVSNFVRKVGNLIKTCENGQTTTFFSTCDSADMYDPLFVSCIYKCYKSLQ